MFMNETSYTSAASPLFTLKVSLFVSCLFILDISGIFGGILFRQCSTRMGGLFTKKSGTAAAYSLLVDLALWFISLYLYKTRE
jgi:hypothetical protein